MNKLKDRIENMEEVELIRLIRSLDDEVKDVIFDTLTMCMLKEKVLDYLEDNSDVDDYSDLDIWLIIFSLKESYKEMMDIFFSIHIGIEFKDYEVFKQMMDTELGETMDKSEDRES